MELFRQAASRGRQWLGGLMIVENMEMAFLAIRANKMRSVLTMLGIIIGIGSVISIVSIGDTMRKLFWLRERMWSWRREVLKSFSEQGMQWAVPSGLR